MSLISFLSKDHGTDTGWMAAGLPALRKLILRDAMIVSSIAGSVLFFSQVYGLAQNQAWPRLAMLTSMLILLITFTLVEKSGYRVRTTVFLLTLLGEGLYLFILYGLKGDGRLYLLGFVVFSAILLEWRQSIRVFILVILILTAVSSLILSDNLRSVIAVEEGAKQAAEWVNGGLNFLMLGLLVQISICSLTRALEGVLEARRNIGVEIQANQIRHENDLKTRTAELEARATLLETAGKFPGAIAQLRDEEDLLNFGVDFLKEKLGFSCVLVYRFDAKEGYFSLSNWSGPAADTFLEQKPRFRLHQPGTLGAAVNPAEPTVIHNQGDDRERFFGPGLEDYGQTLLIPVRVEGQLSAILQVYGDKNSPVTEEALKLYQTIGDQLGYALDNSRVRNLYEAIRNELKAANAQALQKSWRSQLRSGDQIGFRYTNHQLESNVAPSNTAEKAIMKGSLQVIEHPGDPPSSSVAMPIILRDQVLGVLDIRFEGQGIPADMLEMIEAVSNRLALALENTRLLEENQNRAEREHALGEITARVRASSDIDGIMKVAAAEIGRALGVTDVLVQLRSER